MTLAPSEHKVVIGSSFLVGKMWSGPPSITRLDLPRRRLHDLKPYVHFTRQTTPSNCQLQQCNPVQISITVPTSTDTNPTLDLFYGLGVDVPGIDPIGSVEMYLIAPSPPSSKS